MPRLFYCRLVAAAAVTTAIVAASAATAEAAHCDYEDKNDYPPAVVTTHSILSPYTYLKRRVCVLRFIVQFM